MKEKARHHRGRRKKKTAGKMISDLLLMIAIGVFLFSGYKLYRIFAEYDRGDSEYEALQQIVIKQNIPIATEEDLPVEPEFTVDFEALKAMNRDVVGWIRFDEPSQINYPLVRCLNNKKYLNTTFEGKKNAAGALFMDYRNTEDFSDKNTFIYGHNMKNGSMFGMLRKYKNSSFCEENPYFYIYTPDGKESTYQVFAVSIVNDTSQSYNKSYANDEEFLQYIKYIRSISRYSVDVEVGVESQIVSLSTCTNVSEEQRMLVHGVKVEEK